MTRRLLITLVLLLVAGPATAQAAPDERVAAKAYADAAFAYTRDVWTRLPALDDAIVRDAPALAPCDLLEDPLAVKVPDRTVYRVILLSQWRTLRPVQAYIEPPMARLVAALDATPTAEPALRSARAVWRSQLGVARLLASLLDDTCARLQSWAEAGARGTPLPEVDLRGYDDLDDDAGGDAEWTGRVRRLSCAAARLRELGQGPRRAARLTGYAASDAIFPAVRRLLLRGSDGVSEPDIRRVRAPACVTGTPAR